MRKPFGLVRFPNQRVSVPKNEAQKADLKFGRKRKRRKGSKTQNPRPLPSVGGWILGRARRVMKSVRARMSGEDLLGDFRFGLPSGGFESVEERGRFAFLTPIDEDRGKNRPRHVVPEGADRGREGRHRVRGEVNGRKRHAEARILHADFDRHALALREIHARRFREEIA